MKLYYCNKSVINIAHNPIHHERTKHIETDQYFIKEKLEEGIVRNSCVLSALISRYTNKKTSQLSVS